MVYIECYIVHIEVKKISPTCKEHRAIYSAWLIHSRSVRRSVNVNSGDLRWFWRYSNVPRLQGSIITSLGRSSFAMLLHPSSFDDPSIAYWLHYFSAGRFDQNHACSYLQAVPARITQQHVRLNSQCCLISSTGLRATCSNNHSVIANASTSEGVID